MKFVNLQRSLLSQLSNFPNFSTPYFQIMSNNQVEILVEKLGNPSNWKTSDGYPHSLGLCAIDALWSIGIRYSIVEKVLNNYLKQRGFLSGLLDKGKCHEGPSEVLTWMNSSPYHNDYFKISESLGSKNRTSSKNGILKSEVVADACKLLMSNGVNSCKELIANERKIRIKWQSQLIGQSSGISYDYLLMLAGSSGYKNDRMVKRFVTQYAPDYTNNIDQLFKKVEQLCKEMYPSIKVDRTKIDHQMWQIGRSLKIKPKAREIFKAGY